MSKKSFYDWLNSYSGCDCNEECLEQAWNFCASQYESEIAELKKKLEEAVDIIELVDYQFCASFGDAENMRNSVNKARDYLKGVKGEF